MSKPDYPKIAAMERALGISDPAPPPIGEMTGYVVLMDSQDREASDRVRVTFELGTPRQIGPGEIRLDLRIQGGPITLVPTLWGTVRAVAVFDDGSRMPACYPDRDHAVRPGDTFNIVP